MELTDKTETTYYFYCYPPYCAYRISAVLKYSTHTDFIKESGIIAELKALELRNESYITMTHDGRQSKRNRGWREFEKQKKNYQITMLY